MVINVDKIYLLKHQFEVIAEFEKNLNQILRQLLKDNDALLVQMNRDNLDKGKRSDGTEIKPDYTPYTKQLKRLKGQPIDRVTWRDTGALYRTLNIEHRQDEIEFKVDVPYYLGSDGLKQKYSKNGVDGLGLSVKEIIDTIKPQVMELFKDYLFNKKSIKQTLYA